jgi:hypothetical protein
MDSTNCNGSSPTILAQMYCVVPFATLTAAPYSLTSGASVYAAVVATNAIGDSIISSAGNGAVIVISTVPSVPLNLARDQITTTLTQTGLLWSPPASSGGQAILDYKIWWDQGIN